MLPGHMVHMYTSPTCPLLRCVLYYFQAEYVPGVTPKTLECVMLSLSYPLPPFTQYLRIKHAFTSKKFFLSFLFCKPLVETFLMLEY